MEVLAGFVTRLDTPPSSARHHPVSRIARDNPRQPLFFDAMQLSGVSLGPACADVSFCRHGAQVAVSVLKRTGDLRIITAI
ncbi:hypothetical protein [Azospirillum argentinense]|uniref:hypothetical protein n=1 Tax=Azospirillum argentinense TaxID=2970906 RepID=UPI0010C0DDAC|nr:hypothetical protein [Azospirillum argentinense]